MYDLSTLTIDQKREIKRQARLELARRYAINGEILEWGALIFSDRFSLPYCRELHNYFVEIRKMPMTNTEAPRGYSKTTIKCFLILIFQALVESHAYAHYLNVQSTEDKALAVNRSIKHEIENNQMIRDLYGDLRGARWTDGQFVIRHKDGREVIFTCVGAGQSIRGLNYNNIRPDYVVVDDLYDHPDINNPESTMKKTEWFWSDLYKAVAQDGKTSMHIQGTAINKHDLLEELKSKPGIVSRTFREVIDFDQKIVLWPELKNFEKVLEEKARMPETIWFRESQNVRRDDALSIIKMSWLAAWEYDPLELDRMLREEKLYITAVKIGNDPSIGKKVENDFTGTALIIETRERDGEGRQWWIENLWNEKLAQHERIDQLREIAATRPTDKQVTTVKIEAIAGFDDYASEAVRQTNLPVERIDWVNDKITNMEMRSPFFRNGKVHLNKNIVAKLKTEIFDQLTTNHPLHDDMRDAVFLCMDLQALDWWSHVR